MAGRRMKNGMMRQWVSCKECGNCAHYDFIPNGLGAPILTLPCGHGAALRWSDAVSYITAAEAKKKKLSGVR